jgi:hypothetical protein
MDLTIGQVLAVAKQNQPTASSKKFCGVMESMFVCPSSSTGLERVFSSFRLEHTKLRNRLANDRVAKLVKIYCTLRADDMMDNIDELELYKTDQ